MYSPRVELAVVTVLEAHGLHRRKAGRGFEASHGHCQIKGAGGRVDG